MYNYLNRITMIIILKFYFFSFILSKLFIIQNIFQALVDYEGDSDEEEDENGDLKSPTKRPRYT